MTTSTSITTETNFAVTATKSELANFPTKRVFSPIISRDRSTIPRLTTLCLNLLISPRSELPPLLDSYDWDIPPRGQLHPLLHPAALHELIPSIGSEDLPRILQALKTAGSAFVRAKPGGRRGSTTPSLGISPQSKVDPFPRSHRPIPPDDASSNPWYDPCPSPRHLKYDLTLPESSRPSRRLFLHSAEERIEWREVFGLNGLPIKWLGCSPGCLGFLEREDFDDWGYEDE